jgi:ABC-type thiamine transport system substrate-binding protein
MQANLLPAHAAKRLKASEVYEHQVGMRTYWEDMSHIVASTIVPYDYKHICLTYNKHY